MLAVAILAGAACGVAVGYYIPRANPSRESQVVVNGTTYSVFDVNFTRAAYRLACFSGTNFTFPNSTPWTLLFATEWEGRLYQVTLLPETCGFPTINGSFAFVLNISLPNWSPSGGWSTWVWTKDFAFEDGTRTWSNLTISNSEFGIEFFPQANDTQPALGLHGNGGLVNYHFSLLSAYPVSMTP